MNKLHESKQLVVVSLKVNLIIGSVWNTGIPAVFASPKSGDWGHSNSRILGFQKIC